MNALLGRASDHDANEERRYLHEGRHLNLTWSWLWLNWAFGPGFDIAPYGEERWSAWLHVGPFTIEAYWRVTA